MIQPKLYYKNNTLQKNDTKFVLDNYSHLVRWNLDEREDVIDVGCGLGDVTCELLVPRLPETVGNVVGVDYSDDMLEFARSKWPTSAVTFDKLDLGATQPPVDYEEAFHHAFSFYCLHWVQQQRRALQNIYDILRPGGDALLSFLASNPIYTIYEKMANNNKWKPYMHDYKKYISPYHTCESPAKEFRSILTETGFDCRVCEVLDRSFTFANFNVLKQSVMAVSPFITKIPENMWEDYIADYIKEVRRTKGVKLEENNNNNDEKIHVEYKIFVVFAIKPLKL